MEISGTASKRWSPRVYTYIRAISGLTTASYVLVPIGKSTSRLQTYPLLSPS